jgi:hypothetical protein
VTFLLVGSNEMVFAQPATRSQEVWPAVDAYYRFSPRFRLYGTLGGTKKESSYSDGAVGIFADYFTFPFVKVLRPDHVDSLPGEFLWLRCGYQYSTTPPSAEDPFKEGMIVTEANARYHLPLQMLLTWKNRFDWRSKNGDFEARYRPKITVERDLHTDFLFFTVTGLVEYFANFTNGSVNRFKTQLGFELKVTQRINYEAYWNHQFEHQPEIQSVDAFGMTLKIYLQKKQEKSNKN